MKKVLITIGCLAAALIAGFFTFVWVDSGSLNPAPYLTTRAYDGVGLGRLYYSGFWNIGLAKITPPI